MKNLKGFTLLEVIITLALIGAMATLIISLINPIQQFKKARDAQRKSELRQIQAALELYYSDQGAYPASFSCDTALTSVDGKVVYMKKVPCDPVTGVAYFYTPSADNLSYTITSCLENTADAQKDPEPNSSCTETSTSYTLENP